MDEATVQWKARQFLDGIDISRIRDDLSPCVKKANAKVKTEALNPGESGYTVTKPSGKHVITVNDLETPERQRFTICHEIAHIVLELPSNHEEVPACAYAKRDPNEVACDTFAAELLMPSLQWRTAVPNEEPSEALIQRMADLFGASFPAAASRFASLSDRPCAFITMEHGLVRYTARSTSLRDAKAWITPRTPIPADTVAFRLRSAGRNGTQMGEVSQDLWFENWEKGFDLWELSRHYAPTDTTVSLIWFDREDLADMDRGRFDVRPVGDDGGLAELTGELPWPGKTKRR